MSRLIYLVLPSALLLAWVGATASGAVDPFFLPSPPAVLSALVSGLLSGSLSGDLLATVARTAVGFSLASLMGVPLGLLVGRSRRLAELTEPTIDFFRSVPATALFPLFLFFFGVGDASKIVIVLYASSLVILVNTASAARQVKSIRLRAAELLGARRTDLFWRIVLPESSSGILAGLRIALSLSLVLIVVTEMFIGTSVGLGHQIINSQMVYRIPDMYAAIILTGLLGFLANGLVVKVEKRLLHWVGR